MAEQVSRGAEKHRRGVEHTEGTRAVRSSPPFPARQFNRLKSSGNIGEGLGASLASSEGRFLLCIVRYKKPGLAGWLLASLPAIVRAQSSVTCEIANGDEPGGRSHWGNPHASAFMLSAPTLFNPAKCGAAIAASLSRRLRFAPAALCLRRDN
jgi:hypothetical protein